MHDKLVKYFSGELNRNEISSLLKEIKKDDDLKKEFARMQNTYALSQISSLSINREEGKEAYSRFKIKLHKSKRKSLTNIVLQYAAMAVVLIVSTYFISQYAFNNSKNIELNSLYVPAGQRAKLTLEDGSTVWLNANSTLKYPAKFANKKRHVEIEGEAFFDIAKDKKRPFFVAAKNVEMMVLGTQFNVHCYPETNFVKTDLIEGSVKVYMNDSESDAITLNPHEQVTISGNQMSLSKNTNSDYFLWTDGIYSFYNESLLDIINKLQLYYDVKIIIKDPEIFDVKYTGKFRQRDGIDEILRIIQKIRNFDIKKDTEENIITLTK